MTLLEEKLGKDQQLESFFQQWGLNGDPFSLELPTPKAFVPIQRGDMLKILQLMRECKLGILTGGLGMGKTTVCEFLVAALREESLLVSDPSQQVIPVLVRGAAYKTADEFLRAMVLGLGMDADKDSATLFETLRRWSQEHQEKLAVIVDDVPERAANLQEIGEFLRVLADLPSISLLLNGEFKQMKEFLAKVPALLDRVQLHVVIRPLDFAQTKELLELRLRHSGCTNCDGLLTLDGVQAVQKISRGVPRSALKAASNSLLYASRSNSVLDSRSVKKANRRSLASRLLPFLR
ncbi:MAG: ATP-binding protein [Candidatus Hadarchaeota archaeon]